MIVMIIGFTIPTLAHGAEVNIVTNNVSTLFINEVNDEFIQLDEIDGVLYYFRDTSKFTVTITQYKSGYVEIAYKDKTNNSVKVFDAGVKPRMNLNNFSEISKLEGVDTLKVIETIDANTINYNRESEYEIAKRIDNKLSEYYGSPYYGKFRGSLTKEGYTANLYESMHFERYKYYNWFLIAGTAISTVATIVSWPASTIMRIFATYTTGTGVVAIINDFTSYEYVANAHWNKEVKVGSVYPYRAGKTINGRVILGDIDAAYRKGTTRQDYDFDDNRLLMETGIYNYINYGY